MQNEQTNTHIVPLVNSVAVLHQASKGNASFDLDRSAAPLGY
jgi:hypothetical protein